MQREAPDTHFYAEIRDFNLEFLGLVTAAKARCHGAVLGLDPGVVEALGRLDPAQLGEVAATPCLLAGFAPRPSRPGRIAEPPPALDPDWAEQARLFAAGLLTYVSQMSRDPLRAALCASAGMTTIAAAPGARDLRGDAHRALQHLEARFSRHARFWPDLVRASRDGHPERLHLARLTAIQLAMSERRPGGATPTAASRSAVTR
jgi:hypothetical protein